MPFVLSNKPTRRNLVKVSRTSEAGVWEHFQFVAEFRARTRNEVEDMIRAGLPSDGALLESELVGWTEVRTPDGALLEVTPENRTLLLAEPGVQTALARSWLELYVTAGPAQKN